MLARPSSPPSRTTCRGSKSARLSLSASGVGCRRYTRRGLQGPTVPAAASFLSFLPPEVPYWLSSSELSLHSARDCVPPRLCCAAGPFLMPASASSSESKTMSPSQAKCTPVRVEGRSARGAKRTLSVAASAEPSPSRLRCVRGPALCMLLRACAGGAAANAPSERRSTRGSEMAFAARRVVCAAERYNSVVGPEGTRSCKHRRILGVCDAGHVRRMVRVCVLVCLRVRVCPLPAAIPRTLCGGERERRGERERDGEGEREGERSSSSGRRRIEECGRARCTLCPSEHGQPQEGRSCELQPSREGRSRCGRA
jgi:hypothetical protein